MDQRKESEWSLKDHMLQGVLKRTLEKYTSLDSGRAESADAPRMRGLGAVDKQTGFMWKRILPCLLTGTHFSEPTECSLKFNV